MVERRSMGHMRLRERRAVRIAGGCVVVAALLLTPACGIPVDPDGTLAAIASSGELRAGAAADGDLVVVDGDRVTGAMANLVEGFAADHDATVTWTTGSEESLVGLLEDGDLDLAIGGMTADTPWSERVSITRGYPGIPGAAGREIVVLLPLGENGLQSSLEHYLDEEVAP